MTNYRENVPQTDQSATRCNDSKKSDKETDVKQPASYTVLQPYNHRRKRAAGRPRATGQRGRYRREQRQPNRAIIRRSAVMTMQRGYDQVVHDVAIQRLPVRFAIDRAGLVGADGATHAGSFDVAYLANLPGFVVMAAADEAELMHMVATAAAHNDGPIAFRYPRGEGMGVDLPRKGTPLEIGKGRMIRQGARVAILSFGTRLGEVLKAAESLAAKGLMPTIADARFAKPLDRELILQLARDHEALITVEEGAIGGFGSHVAQLLADEGVFDRGLKYRSMVLPDTFIDHASPEAMYRAAGMNAPEIEAKVLEVLGVATVGKRA